MIRKHTAKDLESIMKIWQDSSTLAHPFLKTTFVQKVASDMRNLYLPGSDTWVYERDGVIIAFISMIGNEIGGLFVLPDHHSQGLGTQLVNYVKEFNDQLEVEVFEKNEIGRSFYKKSGFSISKQYIHDESGEKVLRLTN